MSTKITKCSKCESRNIKEINPQSRETSRGALCTIAGECNDCGHRFNIKSWTQAGKRKGIRY